MCLWQPHLLLPVVLAFNMVLLEKELPFLLSAVPSDISLLLSCCNNSWLTLAAFLPAMQRSSNGRRVLSLGEVHSCVVGKVKYEPQAKCLILCSEGSLEYLQLHFFGWVLLLPVASPDRGWARWVSSSWSLCAKCCLSGLDKDLPLPSEQAGSPSPGLNGKLRGRVCVSFFPTRCCLYSNQHSFFPKYLTFEPWT